MKHMILVTSPPACGNSFVTDKLARALKNCVYLDQDSLLVLSAQIFKVANQPNNRSSQFFEDNVRNYEYDAILEVAFEALKYNDYVLINAPVSYTHLDVYKRQVIYHTRPIRKHKRNCQQRKCAHQHEPSSA